MKTITDDEKDTAENRLKKTFFLVESTSFEQFTHWRKATNEAGVSPFSGRNIDISSSNTR